MLLGWRDDSRPQNTAKGRLETKMKDQSEFHSRNGEVVPKLNLVHLAHPLRSLYLENHSLLYQHVYSIGADVNTLEVHSDRNLPFDSQAFALKSDNHGLGVHGLDKTVTMCVVNVEEATNDSVAQLFLDDSGSQ